MWRPDGWKNIWEKDEYYNEHIAYEAGADAMLDCLRKQGEYIKENHGIMEGNISETPGIWVFIPDDEEAD